MIEFPCFCEQLQVMQLMIMSRVCLDKVEHLISETDSLRSPLCVEVIMNDLDTAIMNLRLIRERLREIQR